MTAKVFAKNKDFEMPTILWSQNVYIKPLDCWAYVTITRDRYNEIEAQVARIL